MQIVEKFSGGGACLGADLILTDPPYGVNWQSNSRNVKHMKIQNDGSLEWLPEVSALIYAAMKKDSLMISFYGWACADEFLIAWKKAGFSPKSHLTWVKNNMGFGWFTRGQHESAYLMAKGKPAAPVTAISDVFMVAGTRNEQHPTEKPEALMRAMMAPFTVERGIVLDPFMGSGTTLRAAKDLGRKAVGIEIEEKYCEIAARRMSQGVLF